MRLLAKSLVRARRGRRWEALLTVSALAVLSIAVARVDSRTAWAAETGAVWQWGHNINRPQYVTGLPPIKMVAASDYSQIVLGANGSVWSWGTNDNGQLGDGTTTSRDTPSQIPGLDGIVSVAALRDVKMALDANGGVWTWGGQPPQGQPLRTRPAQVSGLTNIVAVAPAWSESTSDPSSRHLALRSDGAVLTFGYDYTAAEWQSKPVAGLTDIVSIDQGFDDFGGYHHWALRRDGTLFGWGSNRSGELGDGTTTDRTSPAPVGGIPPLRSFSAGGRHVLALDVNGSLWAWGENIFGQLGDGTTTNRLLPERIQAVTGAVGVEAGRLHSIALRNDGTLLSWGYNTHGELGDGTGYCAAPCNVQFKSTPVAVSTVRGVTNVSSQSDETLVVADTPDLIPNPPPTTSQAARILSITPLPLTPTTPLYEIPLSISLADVQCPASVNLSLGIISQLLVHKTVSICGSGEAAPTVVHTTMRVYDVTTGAAAAPGVANDISASITGGSSYSASLVLPPQPIWIGVGDSYTSGHHQYQTTLSFACLQVFILDPWEPALENCSFQPNDPLFSWVPKVADLISERFQAPAAWRMQSAVLARSGAQAEHYDDTGGQVDSMKQILADHHGSWNIVSVTGGADDGTYTFHDALVEWYTSSTLFLRRAVPPWQGVWPLCPRTWKLFDTVEAKGPIIVDSLNRAIRIAQESDPGTRIVDVDYPYVAPLTSSCSKDHTVAGKTYYGAKAVVDRLAQLHEEVEAPNGGLYHIDMRSLIPFSQIQKTMYWGYPHVDINGQFAIASKAAETIN